MSWVDRLIARYERRLPDFVIGDKDFPYLKRWYVIPRNKFFNIYLHNILRSDDDRALHDHPWFNLSIILRGSYFEVRPRITLQRVPGDIVLRSPWSRHRLMADETLSRYWSTWTLFITGPVMRTWGFWCPQGFVPWQKFVAADRGTVGAGCAQP